MLVSRAHPREAIKRGSGEADRRRADPARDRGRRGGRETDDARERLDARGVERAPGLLAQQRQRALGRPRLAVHAVGDERVVDVAAGEDARADLELGARPRQRVAAAVEALVVLADEGVDRAREAAELAQ